MSRKDFRGKETNHQPRYPGTQRAEQRRHTTTEMTR